MSKGMQILGMIILGVISLAIVYLMSDARSTSELDYYLLQEVTEASMYDAVDLSYYRTKNQIRVDRDMFLENFSRRFAQSVSNNRSYRIKIIDFNEIPPKVSIDVETSTVASFNGENAMLDTRISGIIETLYDDFVLSVPVGGGSSSFKDTTPPSIKLRGTTQINISDNVALDKYCLGYIETGKTLDYENFECTSWATNAYGEKEYTINLSDEAIKDFYKDIIADSSINQPKSYTKAVAVYDRAGNSALNTLVYSGPAISLKIYNGAFAGGNLRISIEDTYKPIKYRIILKEGTNESVIKDWASIENIFYEQNIEMYTASAEVEKFVKNYLKTGSEKETKTIIVQVQNDESNKIYSSQELKIEVANNTPTIAASGNKSSHTITWRYDDIDSDAKYYTITNSKSTPKMDISLWNSVIFGTNAGNRGYISKEKAEEGKIYYLWVMDSLGNIAVESFVFNKNYAATPNCKTVDGKTGTPVKQSDGSYTCEYEGCGACDEGYVRTNCTKDYDYYDCSGKSYSSYDGSSRVCYGNSTGSTDVWDCGGDGWSKGSSCGSCTKTTFDGTANPEYRSNCSDKYTNTIYVSSYGGYCCLPGCSDYNNIGACCVRPTRDYCKEGTYSRGMCVNIPVKHTKTVTCNKSYSCSGNASWNSSTSRCEESAQYHSASCPNGYHDTYTTGVGNDYNSCSHHAACSKPENLYYTCNTNGLDDSEPDLSGTQCVFSYDGLSYSDLSTSPEYLLGDVNTDGKVNRKDRTLLARYLVEGQSLTNQQLRNADMNRDGVVDQKDLTILTDNLAAAGVTS